MARGRPKSVVAPCRFCRKQFKRLEHLQRHERIHTREKPFMCDCGRTFSRQDLLSRHERLSHTSVDTNQPAPANDANIQPLVDNLNNPPQSLGLQSFGGVSSHPPATPANLPIVDGPGLESYNAGHHPPGCSDIPVAFTSFDDPDSQSHLDASDELIPWNNDIFSFNNILPSHFLDSGVSLSDLFEQFPAQEQSSAAQMQGPVSNMVHSELEGQPTVHNPPLPPRFPSTDDQLQNSNLDAVSEMTECPWLLSSAAYSRLLTKVAENKSTLPEFKLPSKFTLTRYLEGYFLGFHDHLPFLHVATFDPQNLELELFLAIAAVGALYRFEHAMGHRLYDAARNVVDRSLYNRRRMNIASMTVGTPTHVGIRSVSNPSQNSSSCRPQEGRSPWNYQDKESSICLQRAQALIILMAMSAWGEQSLVQDSLAMGSQLAVLVRELDISEPDDVTNMDLSWLSWVMHQQRRRTLLVAYIIFNLHSITFNVPPLILNQEVALCLPSCEAEWKINSSASWLSYRQNSCLRENAFSAMLDTVIQGQTISGPGAISAFSNYVLIHGIIQRVYIEYQTSSCVKQEHFKMRPQFLKSMEAALRSWQSSWEATYESTLDPCSPKGPLGFNATALLRIAHIRLNANMALCRDLGSGNTNRIHQICTDPHSITLCRSPSMDRAILQCIHALSIPIRVGIPYVARTQTLHWSIQHSISNLECALLLSRWMQEIAKVVRANGKDALREDEHKLLAMASNLVRETHFQESLDYQEDYSTRINRLAAAVARLWAEISSGVHIFNIVDRIGVSLSVIADELESQLPLPPQKPL